VPLEANLVLTEFLPAYVRKISPQKFPSCRMKVNVWLWLVTVSTTPRLLPKQTLVSLSVQVQRSDRFGRGDPGQFGSSLRHFSHRTFPSCVRKDETEPVVGCCIQHLGCSVSRGYF